ncbi:MAG: hypothetical protein M1822_006580 [Bathelium mastoideum]|nr:MAG: hypothetical protein M1822_006580 [Bathelium mastoideum]
MTLPRARPSGACQNPSTSRSKNNRENSPRRPVKKYPSSPVLLTQKRAIEREEREKKSRQEKRVGTKRNEQIETSRQPPFPNANNDVSPLAKAVLEPNWQGKSKFASVATFSEMSRAEERVKDSEPVKTIHPHSNQQRKTIPDNWKTGRMAESQTPLASPNRFMHLGDEAGRRKKEAVSPRRLRKIVNRPSVLASTAAKTSENGRFDLVWERSGKDKGEDTSRKPKRALDEAPSRIPPTNAAQIMPMSSRTSNPSTESSELDILASEPSTSATAVSPSPAEYRHKFGPLSPLQQELQPILWPDFEPGEPDSSELASMRRPLQALLTHTESRSSSSISSCSTPGSYKDADEPHSPTQDSKASSGEQCIPQESMARRAAMKFRKLLGMDGSFDNDGRAGFSTTTGDVLEEFSRMGSSNPTGTAPEMSKHAKPTENASSKEDLHDGFNIKDLSGLAKAEDANHAMSPLLEKSQLRANAKRFDTPPGFRDELSSKRVKHLSEDDDDAHEQVGPEGLTIDGSWGEVNKIPVRAPKPETPQTVSFDKNEHEHLESWRSQFQAERNFEDTIDEGMFRNEINQNLGHVPYQNSSFACRDHYSAASVGNQISEG